MEKIRYIGTKPRKEDNVAGTGVVWHGHNDIQEVPDHAVPKLLAHSNVWEVAGGKPSKAAPPKAAAPETPPMVAPKADGQGKSAVYLMATDEGALDLNGLDINTLHELAKQGKVQVDTNADADTLRQALAQAFPVVDDTESAGKAADPATAESKEKSAPAKKAARKSATKKTAAKKRVSTKG